VTSPADPQQGRIIVIAAAAANLLTSSKFMAVGIHFFLWCVRVYVAVGDRETIDCIGVCIFSMFWVRCIFRLLGRASFLKLDTAVVSVFSPVSSCDVSVEIPGR